jgi:PIN domain nuclease of toxin-antitoxin system
VKVLLDTHCLIKLTTGASLLPRTRKLIDSAEELLVSPISAWEIAMLVECKFIALDRAPMSWYMSALLSRKIRQIELSADILMRSVFLDWEHRDPADRIIVATARIEHAQVATEDGQMRRYLGRK